MSHRFINELGSGEQVNDIYMVKDPILRSTSNGGLYVAMFLCDRTGQLNGRIWQATEATYNLLPKPGFVKISGRSELYQGNLQIVVNKFEPLEASKVNLDDFLARTNKDVNKMFAEIKQIVGQIKNADLKCLTEEFLKDKELMECFCRAPAAVKMHHNFLGGLLEHTHATLKAAVALLPLYPMVQSDLVLAGLFLHDIGKTKELCYDMAFSYTDSGQLIGHIAMSLVMINQKAGVIAASSKALNKEVIDALGHIILSHHGKYEFGSPKLPATAEAFMVNCIDDLDAKIYQVTSDVENELSGDANWTSWNNALQTRVYKKRID
jgi:3'-5' exoribonuclease